MTQTAILFSFFTMTHAFVLEYVVFKYKKVDLG